MAENEGTTRTPGTRQYGSAGWIWAGTWIRERLTTGVAIAFASGLVLGLVVLGWWLWPVQWTDADPGDLKAVHKASYLQMIADAYSLTGNVELARARLKSLKGPEEDDTDLSALLHGTIEDQIGAGSADAAMRLEGLSSAVILPPPPTPGPTSAEPGGIMGSSWLRGVGIAFLVLLLGTGMLLLLRQLQKRVPLRRRRTLPPGEAPAEPEVRITIRTPPETTLGSFETAYNLGDEGYDVSYSVESPTGEFLGECGISALESADASGPVGVVAFELWLFDKEDVRTEARVLMSEEAFGDDALREEMATRGELIEAEQGQVVVLETANLRVDASVIDLVYESGLGIQGFAKLATRLDVFLRDMPS